MFYLKNNILKVFLYRKIISKKLHQKGQFTKYLKKINVLFQHHSKKVPMDVKFCIYLGCGTVLWYFACSSKYTNRRNVFFLHVVAFLYRTIIFYITHFFHTPIYVILYKYLKCKIFHFRKELRLFFAASAKCR